MSYDKFDEYLQEYIEAGNSEIEAAELAYKRIEKERNEQ